MTIENYLKTDPVLTRAVVGFLLIDDKQVILGLRKKVSFGLGANLISGIGGKVGDVEGLENETVDEALKREVREEVGLSITGYQKVAEITFLFPQKPKWNQFVVAYLVNKWHGELTETDVIKPVLFEQDQLPVDSMWDDNRYWVPLVLLGKQLKATFLYGPDNKTVLEKQIEAVAW